MTGLELVAVLIGSKSVARIVPVPMFGTHSTHAKREEGREKLTIAVSIFTEAKDGMDKEDMDRLRANFEL
jgi:hypothetical protein